jgi:insertion element IS1 protein InsB
LYAVEHSTNTILAYVFGKRKDVVFKELQALLKPFNIKRYYTDDWGLMNEIYQLMNMELERKTHKKLSEKI